MKQTYIILIALMALFTTNIKAQELKLFSTEFEYGVRQHIGLTEKAAVTAAQLDTITHLDLSGLAIKDIRDVAYLTNVRSLDLSCNNIDDISALISLEHLDTLNLESNRLTDISMLAFSAADSMYVNVAFNEIQDMSMFFTRHHCDFSFSGMGLQNDPQAEACYVSYFYSSVEDGKTVLNYKTFNNTGDHLHLSALGENVGIEDITELSTYELKGITETEECVISNNYISKSIFAVPFKTFNVYSLERMIIKTGLPEEYSIGFISAQNAEVAVDGVNLVYIPKAGIDNDTVFFSYYQNDCIKGYSEFVVNAPNGINQTELKNKVTLAWNGINGIHISCEPDVLSEACEIGVYDLTGKALFYKKGVNGQYGIDLDIILKGGPCEMVIVKVGDSGHNIIQKLKH